MNTLAILLPVLDRPHAVGPLVESLDLSLAHDRTLGWKVDYVFVCSPGDDTEISAVREAFCDPLIVDWPAGPGDYARKINHAANVTEAEWLFTGADDLRFHPGWLRACIMQHVRTGALVVGTNDMHNPSVVRGMYATHLLVHRDYLARGTADAPGHLLHEGYDHNCVDTELVETARSRGVFAHARDAHVEHLHHIWRGAPDDATYRKGRENHAADRKLLAKRRVLWSRTAVERRRLRSVTPAR